MVRTTGTTNNITDSLGVKGLLYVYYLTTGGYRLGLGRNRLPVPHFTFGEFEDVSRGPRIPALQATENAPLAHKNLLASLTRTLPPSPTFYSASRSPTEPKEFTCCILEGQSPQGRCVA